MTNTATPFDDEFSATVSLLGDLMGDLGTGDDVVLITNDTGTPTQVRLTFTSGEVGNGNPLDAGALANQDGGLAVRVQAEDADGLLTGGIGRTDDEGLTFVAGAGVTFDVRDLVSGVARGDGFKAATLGTSGDDFIQQVNSDLSYYINAGMGNDQVLGGRANDFLVGGAGNDILFGLEGNDSFIGGGGNDQIFGGAGDDTAIFNVSTDGTDQIELGSGMDTVLVGANLAASAQIRLTFTSAEAGNGRTVDGNAMVNQDGGLALRLQAEDLAGNLIGTVSRTDDEGITFMASVPGVTFDVRDLVSGTARGDQFEVVSLGTLGDDRFNESGEAKAYYINAGGGNDRVIGGSGNDFLVGGAGNDTLVGGLGNDSILGGSGDDRVNFRLNASGADVIDLGLGADVVSVVRGVPGQVRLTFTSAEAGNGLSTDAGVLANQDGGLAVRMQAENQADGLRGDVSRFDDEGMRFVGRDGVTFDVRDLVSGAQRGDQFGIVQLGTSGDDAVDESGLGRSVYVNAGMGNDTVTGGNKADFLVGGAGNDVLNGGRGADQLLGGLGNDTFVFADKGSDTVIDFVSGTDMLDFSAFAVAFDDLQIMTVGANTQIMVDTDGRGGVDVTVTLLNTLLVAENDFLFA